MPRFNSHAADVTAAAALLRAHPDYRLLERLPKPYADLAAHAPEGARHIAILDVETTGLDSDTDVIIELGLMFVTVDGDGRLLGHSAPRSWREDPGVPLSVEVQAVTGLRDDDLKGQSLDESAIMAVLSRCSLAIAHNARFDARFVDRRFPALSGLPWACSCLEIPWASLGMGCRKLEHLVQAHGAFFDAHRAGDDVWALFQLLQRSVQIENDRSVGGIRTYLQMLLASAYSGAVRVRATGAPFEAKDWLKARGYAWDAMRKTWWRDVPMADYLAEKAAFAEAGLPEPTGTTIDAATRYRV